MRADRLINIVLRLQSREMATAQDLADELGVSRRTIYRDIETLCEMGVPIYADYGVTGGYHLLEDYGGELNGLTHDERRSLLLLTVPDALTELEIGQRLKTALLKLYARATTAAQQRVLLDWAWWGQESAAAPHLRALYDAVQSDHQVIARYRLWAHLDIERRIDPYGLIFKAGAWYVIAGTGEFIQHYRVSDLLAVAITNTRFTRPADFDLAACWKAICVDNQSRDFEVMLRASPALLRQWTQPYSIVAMANDDDWVTLRLNLAHFDAALQLILPLGGAVEVIAPEALRLTVQDYAAQILRRYGHAAPSITRPSSLSQS